MTRRRWRVHGAEERDETLNRVSTGSTLVA